MAEAIMMGMFIISVLGTLGFSGYGTMRDYNDIKSSVSKVKQRTGDIRTSLDEINKKNFVIDNNIKNNITNAIKQHEKLSYELIVANRNYAIKLKSIQLIGIIIVGIIGLLLILKKTQILKYLFSNKNEILK